MDIQNTDLCPCVFFFFTEMPGARFFGEKHLYKRFRNIFSALYPIIGGFLYFRSGNKREYSYFLTS